MDETSIHAPLIYPPGYSIDVGGVKIPVPKHREDAAWFPEHIQWRRDLCHWVGDDLHRQRQVRAWCAKDPLFFINFAVWITRQRVVEEDGTQRPVTRELVTVPMVTYCVQDELIERLVWSIENARSLLIDKSREMGATFLCVALFHWYWLFRPEVNLGEMSRIADMVDKRGDPNTLFARHDLINKRLPPWLRPAMLRKNMLLTNLENKSSIQGESTTGSVGQGSRRIAQFIDEAARVDNLEAVDRSLADTADCRVYNSTANGPTQFAKMLREQRYDVFALDWSRHPEKGRGRYIGPHPFTGQPCIRSPWFDKQVAAGRSAKDIAMNLERNHATSGSLFFNYNTIIHQRRVNVRTPTHRGYIRLPESGRWFEDVGDLVASGSGEALRFAPMNADDAWSIWTQLDPKTGRPSQRAEYVIGVDISMGTGASQSHAYVMDADTGEQVAELASSNVSPDELAEMVALAGMWFGGRNGCAFVGWEANGVGQRFGRQFVRVIGYPRFMRTISELDLTTRRTQRLGWWSSGQSRLDLLGELDQALSDGTHTTRSASVCDQLEDYVWFEGREGVGPGVLERETADTRALHGDGVIAAGIAEHCRRFVDAPPPTQPERVPNTASETLTPPELPITRARRAPRLL
jgi:hypothetical protein